MDRHPAPAMIRIGELSRRLGLSDHVLRAWERRYGVLRPVRTAGGFRLYSDTDLRRVQCMQEHLSHGLSAAEAARTAIEEVPVPVPTPEAAPDVGLAAPATGPPETVRELAAALDGLDEVAAQALLDRLFNTLTVEMVIRDVLLPYLHELGECWQRGEVSVGQEHFASNLIRERLAGLGRGWGGGLGPRALLACAPGELHDIALIAFGVVLHRNGWRISYLGANTPLDDLARIAAATRPDLVVLATADQRLLDGLTDGVAAIGRTAPLAIAGAGATIALANRVGARLLAEDPVTAAERMSPPARDRPGRPRR